MNRDEPVVAALERIEHRLASVERWLRFANMDKLKEILLRELGEDRKKLAYELSDGTRGYREVGLLAGAPAATVQAWWGRWLSLGIMEPSSVRAGRVQRLCSLREVGIDSPPVPAKKVTTSVESPGDLGGNDDANE